MLGGTEREVKKIFKRSGFDRRLDYDRRKTIDLNVLESLPFDRRRRNERRRRDENRVGWLRISSWSSVFVGEEVKFRIEVTGSSTPAAKKEIPAYRL